tara:strand:- start:33 stop:272 length:240 start_codon:yes stop_codon:yes gene_type:complete
MDNNYYFWSLILGVTMSKREINLLTKKEVEERYDIPDFNDAEREQYFCLSSSELKLLKNYRTVNTQIHFVLMLGYFNTN